MAIVRFVGGHLDGVTVAAEAVGPVCFVVWHEPGKPGFFVRIPPVPVIDRIERGELTKQQARDEAGGVGGWAVYEQFTLPGGVGSEYREAGEKYGAMGSPELQLGGCSGTRGPRRLVMGPSCNTLREEETWTIVFTVPEPDAQLLAHAENIMGIRPRPAECKFKREAARSRDEAGNLVITLTDSWRA